MNIRKERMEGRGKRERGDEWKRRDELGERRRDRVTDKRRKGVKEGKERLRGKVREKG